MGDIFGPHVGKYWIDQLGRMVPQKWKKNHQVSIVAHCLDGSFRKQDNDHSSSHSTQALSSDPGTHKNNKEDVFISLVGGIMGSKNTKRVPNVIHLRIGLISPKHEMRDDAYPLGVRGTRTRDGVLLQTGRNPEIVGDPGLYFATVFHEIMERERAV